MINWNNLPPEMKIECIKRMDLRTKYNLHVTSRSEQNLVKSHMFALKDVHAFEDGFADYTLYFREQNDQEHFVAIPKTNVKKGKYIMDFVFSTILSMKTLLIDNCPAVFFEKLNLVHLTHLQKITLIDCCNDVLNQIGKSRNGKPLELLEVLSVNSPKTAFESIQPSFFRNIATMSIHFNDSTNVPTIIAKDYIINDDDFGTQTIFSSKEKLVIEKFASNFSESLQTAETRNTVRISTNNSMKHIILVCEEEEEQERDYYVVLVIPSALETSEYKTYVKDGRDLLVLSAISRMV